MGWLVLVDWAWARFQGWSGRGEGPWRLLVWPALAFVLLLLFASLLATFRGWLGRHARQLWLTSGAFLTGLFIAEQGLRWTPCWSPFHGRPPSVRYHFEPDFIVLPGVRGAATSSINSWGLRGSEPPPRSSAYRIICLGGSTTEGCYLDDSETWPAQFQQRWKRTDGAVWVASAGVSDFESGHHLRWLESSPLVSQVDCVVVLVGVNDLVRRLLGFGSGSPAPPRLLQLGTLDLLKQIWNVRLGHGLLIDAEGGRLTGIRRDRPIEPPPSGWQLESGVEEYGRRLTQMCEVARRRGVRLVFVTEPVLWDDYLGEESLARMWLARMKPEPRDWEILRPGRLRESMDLYNLELLKVCRQQHVEVLDAAAPLSGIDSYFYDDYHLSEQGCAVLGKLLADYFATHPTPPGE